MTKQTAVEWLVKEYHLPQDSALVQQAKEMEKKRMMDAVVWFDDTDRRPYQIEESFEQYYKETYGGDK